MERDTTTRKDQVMTVRELKAILDSYPDDLKVVINNSRDYEDFGEVEDVSTGTFSNGFGGGQFEYAKKWNRDVNSIVLT